MVFCCGLSDLGSVVEDPLGGMGGVGASPRPLPLVGDMKRFDISGIALGDPLGV